MRGKAHKMSDKIKTEQSQNGRTKFGSRTLISLGGSTASVIPPRALENIGLSKGDEVTIEYDGQCNELIISEDD